MSKISLNYFVKQLYLVYVLVYNFIDCRNKTSEELYSLRGSMVGGTTEAPGKYLGAKAEGNTFGTEILYCTYF